MTQNRFRSVSFQLTSYALLVIFTGSLLAPWGALSTVEAHEPPIISLTEAEILIYLLPQAQELRRQGMDVGWERQTSARLNQKNFYVFWVVNNKRSPVEGSVRVGFFAVSKFTAEVWDDDLETIVSGPDLAGIQNILRKAHQ